MHLAVVLQPIFPKSMSFDEFYARMAAGAEKTSQINADEFEGYFRSFLEQRLDVLHVCRSSGITGVIGQVLGICPLLNMDYLGRLTHDIKSERKKRCSKLLLIRWRNLQMMV